MSRNLDLKNKPLVTIVTVTFNIIESGRHEYFKQCLESVHSQTYKNIEHIIIDGESKDGTVELIKEYSNKGWIKYISERDKGIYDAMNKGVDLAKGKYVAFLNSDDFYHNRDAITLSVLKLEKSKAVFSYADYVEIDKNKKRIVKGQIEKFLYSMPFGHPTMLTNLSVIRSEDGFNLSYGFPADYGLIIRLILKDYKGIYLSKDIVSYRVGGLGYRANYSNEIAKIYYDHYSVFHKTLSLDQARKIRGELKLPDGFIDNFSNFARKKGIKHIDINRVIGFLLRDMKQFNIVANIATFPERLELFKKTVESILHQVDKLNVYLNNFNEIPDFLNNEKINAVLSKDAVGDLKDNGKFYFLDKALDNEYYFTIDDDIVYPGDYVSKMIEFLQNYDNKVAIGVHGIIFHRDFKSFCRTRTSFYFEHALEDDMIVSALGTGTLVFHKNLLNNISLRNFYSPGMADLWFAVFCKEKNVPLLCVQREKQWLKNTNTKDEDHYALWNESLKNDDAQNRIINKYRLWELSVSGERKYRSYLENKPTRILSSVKKNELLEDELILLKKSKSFLLGNLFFRSIKNPKKIITFPINFIRILLNDKSRNSALNLNSSDPTSSSMFYCSVCNKKTIFNDAGNPARKMVLCSNCGSLERHRFLYYVYGLLFLNTGTNINLLHMAPEKCLYGVLVKKENINYQAADLHPENFSHAPCVKEDFIKMSFLDKSFDVILSNHVLEHIEKEKECLLEMRRCLNDSGFAILSIPYKPSLRETFEDGSVRTVSERKRKYGQEDHVRLYGNDVSKRLEKAGFSVNQIHPDMFPDELSKLYRFKNIKCSTNGIEDGYFILRKKLL